jgi:hypothetical protein
MINPDQATIEAFNRRRWAENHRDFRYFAEHPDYARPASSENLLDDTSFYDSTIRRRFGIDPAGKTVCEIGIGYGRLSANFNTARHLYGIDVSRELFQTTAKYLESKGIGSDRFTLLLSDEYKNQISVNGDFVFSSIVFQHIPKSFQVDYLRFFAGWLHPGGEMLIQFLVGELPDAPLTSQPSFFWKVPELFEVVSGLPLTLRRFEVELVVPGETPCYWAWVHWVSPMILAPEIHDPSSERFDQTSSTARQMGSSAGTSKRTIANSAGSGDECVSPSPPSEMSRQTPSHTQPWPQ